MKRDVLYNRIILSVFLLSLVSCVAIYFCAADKSVQYEFFRNAIGVFSNWDAYVFWCF